MWESISTIFSMLLGSISGEVILFSTARQTPSEVWIPMAVEPSWKPPPSHHHHQEGTWLTRGRGKLSAPLLQDKRLWVRQADPASSALMWGLESSIVFGWGTSWLVGDTEAESDGVLVLHNM